jgi:hypothetical protein
LKGAKGAQGYWHKADRFVDEVSLHYGILSRRALERMATRVLFSKEVSLVYGIQLNEYQEQKAERERGMSSRESNPEFHHMHGSTSSPSETKYPFPTAS